RRQGAAGQGQGDLPHLVDGQDGQVDLPLFRVVAGVQGGAESGGQPGEVGGRAGQQAAVGGRGQGLGLAGDGLGCFVGGVHEVIHAVRGNNDPPYCTIDG